MEGWKVLFHLLLIALAFLALALLFRSVATPGVAVVIAATLTVAEVAVLIGTGKHGGGVRALAVIGLPLIAFPFAGWGIRIAFRPEWYITIPIAAAIGCAAGMLGARNGSGRDTRRLAEALVAVVIPLYAITVLVVDGAPLTGIALGIAAVAVAPITTKVAVTWPGHHEDVLVFAAGAAAVWAVLVGVIGWA